MLKLSHGFKETLMYMLKIINPAFGFQWFLITHQIPRRQRVSPLHRRRHPQCALRTSRKEVSKSVILPQTPINHRPQVKKTYQSITVKITLQTLVDVSITDPQKTNKQGFMGNRLSLTSHPRVLKGFFKHPASIIP